jgi:hypothetical protein
MSEKLLFFEAYTPDELREAWTENVLATQTSAHTICRAGGVTLRGQAGGVQLLTDRCFCLEPVIYGDESINLDRMRIRGDHVFCPVHENKISARELMDTLPLGTRKDVNKRDRLLAGIPGARPVETRFYVFRSGTDYTAVGIDADPIQALADARPSHKLPLQGCLIQCAALPRARELVKLDDGLPYKELSLRDDGDLDADWHGEPLQAQEAFNLQAQQQATAKLRRLERLKVVDRLRLEAEQLAMLP